MPAALCLLCLLRLLCLLCLQIWIIVYGQMQSWTPQLILGPLKQAPPNKWVAALWCGILTVVPLTLGIVMLAGGAQLLAGGAACWGWTAVGFGQLLGLPAAGVRGMRCMPACPPARLSDRCC